MTFVHTMPAKRGVLPGSTVRRYRGPSATELSVLCRPDLEKQDMGEQTVSIYGALDEVLRAEGAKAEHVLSENIFFGNIGRDFETFRQVRSQMPGSMPGGKCYAPSSTFIQQPPVEKGCLLLLSAYAVIPNQKPATAQPLLSHSFQANRRTFQVNGCRQVFIGNIYGSPGNAAEEAYSMFRCADDFLQQDGMSLKNVVRTWIYLRNMERDYSGFNQGRSDYFKQAGISLRPASTGIGGLPYPAEQNLSLSLQAIQPGSSSAVEPMSTPTLNEAWAYGSDFSRGLKVEGENGIAFFISGTASIDERGRSIHAGDFDGQAERMIRNISTLLEVQKASYRDVISATTYLKDATAAPRLLRLMEKLGIGGFPNAMVQAEVCRPELLCEMEVLAKREKGHNTE
jgi:enamine deaminase RidA (YjgF/YER057c/UK114 family)